MGTVELMACKGPRISMKKRAANHLLIVLVLVAGCGEGYHLHALKKIGAEVQQYDQGKVFGLNLKSGELNDSHLAHLEGLTRLTHLAISDPDITGTGLAHLTGLINLKSLKLYTPKITDADLVHLQTLKNLQTLVLRNPSITGSGIRHLKPLSHLAELRIVHIYGHCNIRDSALAHLKDLPHLKSLTLDSDQVTAKGLEQLRYLTKLEQLHLEGAQITNDELLCFQELVNLKGLTLRNLTHNEAPLSGDGLKHLQPLQNLEYLNCGPFPLTDADLEHLNTWPNLAWFPRFPADYRRVTDAGLQYLRGLPLRSELNFHDATISGAGLRHLKGLAGVKSLNLSATRITDSNLVHLQGIRHVADLNLTPSVIDSIAAFLSELAETPLDLQDPEIFDEILFHATELKRLATGSSIAKTESNIEIKHLKSLATLVGLNPSTPETIDHIRDYLHSHAGLTSLDLRNTQLTDASLVHLTKLSSLRTLDIRATRITEDGVTELKMTIPNCRIMH